MSSAEDKKFETLVAQTRANDQKAYKTLLESLAPLLRKMVYSQMERFGKQDYIEDVVQETLLAVHLKLHTYDSAYPFLAWVRVIARHKTIDFLRRTKKQSISIDEDNFGELPDPMASSEVRTIHRDLDLLLSQLKPPAGDLIYALKVEGASIKDLAQTFKLSESNVKVLIHRGLQKLSALVRQQKEGISL